MMMDDDVICEPEGIIRAVTFGDLARRPTIVGGHMFSIYSRARLHSFGEVITPWRFWWLSAPGVFPDWDFGARNLRSTRWLHKRDRRRLQRLVHVPDPAPGARRDRAVACRCSSSGTTPSSACAPRRPATRRSRFPGAAVWHIPWTDKNDALDWQAYFHQRNRFVAALLHSPYERGGRMVRESLNHQIAHLVSMQYSTVELRLMALEDVLAGPDALHETLPTQAGRGQRVPQAVHRRPARRPTRDAFPPVRRHKPPRKGKDDSGVPSRAVAAVRRAARRRCGS